MTCSEARERDLAELYCLKRLSAEEAADYEDHYFGCQSCYGQLSAVQDLRAHLAMQPPVVRRPPPQYRWLTIAAALVMVVSGPVWLTTRHAVDPYPELARVDPPEYTAPVVRGPDTEGPFAAAMAAYRAKRYADAIVALDAVAIAEPDNVAAPYYAASCDLALGHPAEAARRFAAVAGKGESRFQESAYWYEAKAWIGVRNRAGAEQALTKMLPLNGTRSSEGKALLDRLRQLH